MDNGEGPVAATGFHQLDECERAVIRAHDGLGEPALTLNQIARALGPTSDLKRVTV